MLVCSHVALTSLLEVSRAYNILLQAVTLCHSFAPWGVAATPPVRFTDMAYRPKSQGGLYSPFYQWVLATHSSPGVPLVFMCRQLHFQKHLNLPVV